MIILMNVQDMRRLSRWIAPLVAMIPALVFRYLMATPAYATFPMNALGGVMLAWVFSPLSFFTSISIALTQPTSLPWWVAAAINLSPSIFFLTAMI